MAAAGCKPEDPRLSPGGLYGTELIPPRVKPDFTLTATDGIRFPFRARTDGYLTLLFFGYTNCPDICPVHMANIAAVMKKLPARVTERMRVVFVTTDPARDTPEHLRRWLDGFDPTFIGLTGTDDDIRRAEDAAGVPPAAREVPGADSADAAPASTVAATGTAGTGDSAEYTVGHAAYVIAYAPDNRAHAMYPFGTRQSDWAHDLPKLANVTASASSSAASPAGPLVDVTGARVLATPGADVAAGYFRVRNAGTVPLTLVSVSAVGARQVSLHQERRAGNVMRMVPAGPFTIEPGKSLVLSPGAAHLMLSGLARPLAPGDTVQLTLTFEGAGSLTVEAPVHPYGEDD
ncbi:MAG TPA: copper chaperone PCu(A)C [Gemmatimonadales bacterium]|nr:copper chaperone PCu(A)C [Gemmatimonadales bacterium]